MRRSLPVVSALIALLAALPAVAGADARTQVLIDDAAPDAALGQSACYPGQTEKSVISFGGFVDPGTTFYTLLDADSCDVCGDVPLQLVAAWIRLRSLVTCSLTLDVSIVGAGADPGCRRPEPSIVLCPPERFTLTQPAGRPALDHEMRLAAACCIRPPAFLRVDVVGTDCDYPDPFIGVTPTTGVCTACAQWWNGFDAGPSLVDFCAEPGSLGANLSMWTEANCCGATPAHGATWGAVKIRYR